MPYHVRAFCTDEFRPSIDELEAALKRDNPAARFETDDERTSADWCHAYFYYKEGKEPVVVEVNVDDSGESLAAEECREFADEIGRPGISLSERRVLSHLTHTQFIVCCQLKSDIDDDGYRWNGELLNYYVMNHGGMIHADGEGFYDGDKIIVDLP